MKWVPMRATTFGMNLRVVPIDLLGVGTTAEYPFTDRCTPFSAHPCQRVNSTTRKLSNALTPHSVNS